MDKNFGDLTARNCAIAGITGLARIALHENEPMLVRAVVVEPAGAHDCVWQSTGADQPLGTPLPVMGFGGAVVVTCAIGDPDGRHQRDPCRA